MGTTIFKYEIPLRDEFTISLPRGAQVIAVQVQADKCGERPCIWVRTTRDTARLEDRWFFLRGTGHDVETGTAGRFSELRHVGTFQMNNGKLVFHLFEPARA